MAQRLTKDNVREILMECASAPEYWPDTDQEARENLSYIAGLKDMANAVIRKITELGG